MASTRIVRIARSALVAGALAGTAFVAPHFAGAAPVTPAAEPTTSAQVQAKLTSLSKASEMLSEQLNAAQISVKAAQAKAVAASEAVDVAHTKLATARSALAASLSMQYKASSFSHTAALLSSASGQSYIDTVQSLNLLAAHQAEVAKIATAASAQSQAAEAVANSATIAAVAQRDKLASKRTALNAQVSKYKALLETISAAERAKYYAAQAATPLQVQTLTSSPVPAKSKGAAAAIAAARAMLGRPYSYGASGPDSFDCSGLTAWAWAAAGVSLPHNAAAQYGYGTHVSQSQLQPGDLVFFYSPIGHVGIYIGNGLMIHAPTTGDVVRIAPVFANGDYVGATRVG